MDKTIFEVEISNSGPKSYETATVMKMPASFAEFSDALQKARIKDGSFCKNELTCIHYNGLTHAMIGWNANLYDLNLFAQRLASLTEEQKKGMDALLKIKQNHRVAPIQDGETIDGVADGQMSREIQWKCQYEDALIQPPREVLDIHMGKYASGGR